MTAEHDSSFAAMGSHLRLLIGEPRPRMAAASAAAADVKALVAEFEATLSRFKPDSELCRLNEDLRERVPASALLRAAVRAGLAAAERSDGLVDPTLVDEIEAAGYRASRAGMPSGPLAAALAAAPPRHPARPRRSSRWREFEVDDAAATVTRPPGLRFDTGGSGKGLAADLISARLSGYSRSLVDCGGDIRVGSGALAHPYEVFVEHPLTGEMAYSLRLGSGGVATSGLGVRVWRRPGGGYAHHLLDPSTGAPAWTGLIAATALGDSAVEAETIAKTALLSGAEAGRAVLLERGGLLVHDGGEIEVVGPISARPLRASAKRRAGAPRAGARRRHG